MSNTGDDNDLSFCRVVGEEDAGLRADAYLGRCLSDHSRSEIVGRLEELRINGLVCRSSKRVSAGDRVEFRLYPAESKKIEAEPIDLDIVHESCSYLVINKPAGMVVHPANGNRHGTLVQALLYRYPEIRERFGSADRPGIVHRLDRETSGLVIVAKEPEVSDKLARQFASRRTRKRYLAIVKGEPPASEGRITGYIRRDPHHRKRFAWSAEEGKYARTDYRVLARFSRATLVALAPFTGRTHQLRVHMQHLGCPILGDTVYTRGSAEPEGMMLHAVLLQIRVPDAEHPRTFVTRFPERFHGVIARYGGPESGEDPRWLETLREW